MKKDRFLFLVFYIFVMNKPMFWIGIVIIVITVILLVFTDLETSPIMVLGIIGIVSIGASNYRLIKKKK